MQWWDVFWYFASIFTTYIFGNPVARLVPSLIDIRWGTERNFLANRGWMVFEVFGEIFELLGVEWRIVCSSFEKFVSFPTGKFFFDGTEPLFVQYLSELTVFGVKSMSNWP